MTALFEPGDLDTDGLFIIKRPGRAPESVFMSADEVCKYLSISERDLTTAATRRQIRRVGAGRYATSTVTPHRRGSDVCSTAQACAVLCRSETWFRNEVHRLGIENFALGTQNRWLRRDVNAAAKKLRALDNMRAAARITAAARRRAGG